MPAATQLSDIVQVTAEIRAAGVAPGGHGITLFLTTGGGLDGSGPGKVRSFRRLVDVGTALGTTSEAYLAAQVHFGQVDTPREFKVCRWTLADVPTVLTGGAAPEVAATIGGISNGSFAVGGVQVTGIDLSSASTYADQATVIQVAVRAADATLATVEVGFANGRFVFTLPSGAALPASLTEAASGTFLGALLGLDADSNPTLVRGGAAETVAEALGEAENLTPFYFVAIEKRFNGTDTIREIAAWANGTRKVAALGSSEPGALVTGDAATNIALVSDAEYPRAFGVFSSEPDYKSVAAAARMGAVHLERPSSIITLNLKSLAGVQPDRLSRDAAAELDRKNINYYVPFDGGNGFIDGTTFRDGTWVDAQYFVDWLVSRFESEVFAYMQRADVPRSPGIRETCLAVLEQARASGAIAPGTVSTEFRQEIAEVTQNPEFDGYLTNGHFLFVADESARTQLQRDERVLPDVRCWLKGAEAIHRVEIGLTFEN